MQITRRLVLLAGMLTAFTGWVSAQHTGATVGGQSGPARIERGHPTLKRGAARDELLREAEIAARKAAALQEQQSEKSLSTAAGLFQESSRNFHAAHSDEKAAAADLEAGDIAFTLSRYDQALSSYRRILTFAGQNSELRCRGLSRIARTYVTTGRPSQDMAGPLVELERCRGLSRRVQAEVEEGIGEALQYSDRPKSAEFLTEAASLFADEGDQNGEAQSLLALAYIRFRADPAEGRRYAAKALELWRLSKNDDGIAQAHNALGIFARVTGEYETAQCNYRQALPILQRIGDKDNAATAWNAIGSLSRQTGDLDSSLEDYARARLLFANARDQLGVVEAITGLTQTLMAMQRYREVLPLYTEKLRLVQKTENSSEAASVLLDMAGVYEQQRKYAAAENFYNRALAGYRGAQDYFGESNVFIRQAGLRVLQARYEEAISLLEDARTIKEKHNQIEEIASIQYELAYIYRRLGRLEDARNAIAKTIEIIESQRLKITSFDSRAAYFASVNKYYSLYIQILMLLHGKHPEQNFLQLAFEASEKSKVRALLDLLSTSSQNSSCDELLQRQLAPVTSDEAPSSAVASSPVLTLPQVQSELEADGTVLVEYALGDEKSYVWAVDRKGIVAHEIAAADRVRKVVRRFEDALTAPQPRPGESSLDESVRVRKAEMEYPRLARDVSRLLLGSLALEQAKRILIVPDGLLQYIPFSALPLPRSKNAKDFLVSHYDVINLPSASALSTLRKLAAGRTPPGSLAAIIADPVFDRDDSRVRQPYTSHRLPANAHPNDLKVVLRDVQGLQRVERLLGSSDEADAISRALAGEGDVLILKGFDATREYVLSGQLDRYKMIHFATHGMIDARHPEMSGLILSLVNERGKHEDGYLRLGDIYKLKLSADLVVLSACNSALGKDLASEGTIGLPRAFLYAGAKTVIASLWKVEDTVTAEFMKGFYERIRKGKKPGEALRAAQLKMAQKYSPFYWAAFVLQGDYN